MLPVGNILKSWGLCEICVTECCTVVQSTAIAMGELPVNINNIRYLQTKWRTPKAGVTGSIRGAKRRQADRRKAHPVGRANLFNRLRGVRCLANCRGAHLVPKR